MLQFAYRIDLQRMRLEKRGDLCESDNMARGCAGNAQFFTRPFLELRFYLPFIECRRVRR